MTMKTYSNIIATAFAVILAFAVPLLIQLGWNGVAATAGTPLAEYWQTLVASWVLAAILWMIKRK